METTRPYAIYQESHGNVIVTWTNIKIIKKQKQSSKSIYKKKRNKKNLQK